jgi:peptidyl-dipeptidase Dcp
MPDAVNPLLGAWHTPYEIPPFAEIEPEHFQPAFKTALAANLAEIEAIATNPEPPTFENTIAAFEDSGRALHKVSSVFFNLSGASTNPDLQAIEREIAPELARHHSKITSNAALFARIDDLYRRRDSLNLTAEQLRVLENTHLDLVRAGAALDAEGKQRMADIRQRLATLYTRFSQNVLADEAAYTLRLNSGVDFAGLPPFLVEAAASAARERGLPDRGVITLSRSLIEPFLTFSDRRDLREEAYKAWLRRGENGGETDNRALVTEILALRRDRARLLGYDTFAAYKLDDTMAKAPPAVTKLLETVWAPARAKAEEERKRLAEFASSKGVNDPIEPWDWRYWAEKVRAADYALDEARLKPYLPLERIIEAAFATAGRLFGLKFEPVKNLELYHPDVRAFAVSDANGRHVGLFLGDYFARPSKRSGAWMSSYRSQERFMGEIRPIIVNVMNFAKAPEGQPTLLSMDDAHTLFHEFGHGLHGLLSNVSYPSLAGTSVARDFVELPSQLYEHWLDTPEVLSAYARHCDTGEPMPADMIAKVRAARTFNQGFATVEYLASALVDIAYHTAAEPPSDPMKLEAETLARIGMPREIGMRHRTPHFAHIFSGDGYSAGYYSYMWSEVLDADAFAAFQETGDAFDQPTARRLLEYVYSAGGLRREEDAYVGFRGRLPSIDGLLRKRGLTPNGV